MAMPAVVWEVWSQMHRVPSVQPNLSVYEEALPQALLVLHSIATALRPYVLAFLTQHVLALLALLSVATALDAVYMEPHILASLPNHWGPMLV
jgi:hypothetical protein